MTKCFICEEKTNPNYDVVSLKGKSAHPECKDSQSEYASRLFNFQPDGEIEKTIFDDDFIYCSEADNYDQLPKPVKETKWVKTDGWRGYTAWELESGFIEVGDGWITGWPDETTERKLELGEIFEKLNAGKLIPPVELFWLFGHTSNVFSTASTLVIRNKDKAKFIRWLKTINGNLKEWRAKFS